MITKEDLIAKGYTEKEEGQFEKTYGMGMMIINGQPIQNTFNLRITLDNLVLEHPLGSYLQFSIYADDVKRWITGRTGYYHTIEDLQKDMPRLQL